MASKWQGKDLNSDNLDVKSVPMIIINDQPIY